MTFVQSIILSIVQGISEFLPVSSSGHLNIFQHFLGLTPSLTFDIFLNTASLLTVLFFFRRRIDYFFKNFYYIVIASIPAALIGVLFKNQIEIIFADIKLLPYFFLITTFYLLISRFFLPKNNNLDIKKALIIGAFQAFAIMPAVSRSGSTIFAGLLLGLSPIDAFNFSFALFIPASVGAILLDAKNLASLNFDVSTLTAFVTTFVVGIFALNLLQKTLISRRFWLFGIYTFVLAIILFFLV